MEFNKFHESVLALYMASTWIRWRNVEKWWSTTVMIDKQTDRCQSTGVKRLRNAVLSIFFGCLILKNVMIPKLFS